MNDEIREIPASQVCDSPHWNPDIAPVGREARRWGMWDIASLWVGMSVCIPTYMLASSLISQGMDWKQAILTVLLGNIIVLLPMILNAHAGTRYGIPFPVFCRASFGVLGSNLPAIMRAFVACGWFGIQTWIGGWAIYRLAEAVAPNLVHLPRVFPSGLGLETGPFLCFMLFWLLNMYIVWKGMESIRFLENWGAPFLIIVGIGLLVWAVVAGGGLGPIFQRPARFANSAEFWKVFFPSLTAMVGYWATLSLNIPDFTRFAKSQKDQMLGQAMGLPGTMTLYAFIGVAVTSATVAVFGKEIWNPTDLLAQFHSLPVVIISMLGLTVATLTTNLAANVVSPANDFSNLSPRRISFRMGGLITGILGIIIMPWKLIADPHGYIFKWLVGYSALLGPIGGILIADYFIIRKMNLDQVSLYQLQGSYHYYKGFNLRALPALLLGILPSLPGFLMEIGVVSANSLPPLFTTLYTFAWFVGFGVSFVAYLLFMLPGRKREGNAG